ncbi:MAG: DUF262 domain-containing protein [Veillonella sp.]|nr:DUF262 domain-containing protein [Veillonella sp.]
MTFSIPYYQRGYRWTADNVEKLLEDLVEFVGQQDSSYCLQPIVLQCLGENKFRVVDGQQRLTTIALIMSVIKAERTWKIIYDVEEYKELAELLQESGNNTINNHFRTEVLKTINIYKQ